MINICQGPIWEGHPIRSIAESEIEIELSIVTVTKIIIRYITFTCLSGFPLPLRCDLEREANIDGLTVPPRPLQERNDKRDLRRNKHKLCVPS